VTFRLVTVSPIIRPMWGDRWALIRRHVVPSIGAVLGAVLSVGGIVLHGLDLVALGLPEWVFEAVGAGIFFCSLIAFTLSALAEAQYAPSLPQSRPTQEPIATRGQDSERATARDKPRLFVGDNVTPKSLTAFYEGKTQLEGDRAVAPFKGKWIKISAQIKDIGSSTIGTGSLMITASDESPMSVLMVFSREWDTRLSILGRGDRITVIGMIRAIGVLVVILDECELVG
jgi:hypothetical protein